MVRIHCGKLLGCKEENDTMNSAVSGWTRKDNPDPEGQTLHDFTPDTLALSLQT